MHYSQVGRISIDPHRAGRYGRIAALTTSSSVVFFDRLVGHPEAEFERIGRFLGVEVPLRWDNNLKPQNVGRERLRSSHLRESLVRVPVLTALRRRLLPGPWVERLKKVWRVDMDPPQVPEHLAARLRDMFDPDLARLGEWLGMTLDTDSFHDRTREQSLSWLHLKQCQAG